MQFIVTGLDGDDAEAPARRLAVRGEHLALCETSAARGELLYAVALLDDEGAMRGSVMVVEYPSRAELEEWLKHEPYVTGHVWKAIDIKPCKTAPVFQKKS